MEENKLTPMGNLRIGKTYNYSNRVPFLMEDGRKLFVVEYFDGVTDERQENLNKRLVEGFNSCPSLIEENKRLREALVETIKLLEQEAWFNLKQRGYTENEISNAIAASDTTLKFKNLIELNNKL